MFNGFAEALELPNKIPADQLVEQYLSSIQEFRFTLDNK
jgi:hypothetical protein